MAKKKQKGKGTRVFFNQNHPEWRELILPKRTDKEFWDEGKIQAQVLSKEFNNKGIILEYGCGIGRILTYLTAKEKHGADGSALYLSKIKEKSINKHLTDGLSKFYHDNYFDFIYSIMVFQHIDKKYYKSILITLFNTLKPGGEIYIQFPNGPNEIYAENQWFVNIHTKEELNELFKEVGFKNINITKGNLIAYGSHGSIKPQEKVEFFVKAKKVLIK